MFDEKNSNFFKKPQNIIWQAQNSAGFCAKYFMNDLFLTMN